MDKTYYIKYMKKDECVIWDDKNDKNILFMQQSGVSSHIQRNTVVNQPINIILSGYIQYPPYTIQ
jgi:hypothetical protein